MLSVWWRRLWPYCALGVVSFSVFGRSIGGEFLSWDDTQHLILNPWLQAGDVSHFWKSDYYGLYIPLTYTIWTWLFHLWPEPVAFHVLNLLLHTVNSCLVFVLAKKVLWGPQKDSLAMLERECVPFALLAAMTFTLHPFQVETVAWISGGRDLLAAFFGLAATLVAWNTADRLFPSWAALLRRILATWFYVLALLCKPALAVLPLALKWLSRFTERRGLKWSMMWLWLALSAVIGGITAYVQSDFVGNRLGNLSFSSKVLVAWDALWFYLRKFLFTDFFSADYGRTPERVLSGEFGGFSAWPLAAVCMLALGIALWWAWTILPGAIRGGLGFFVLMLLPVLGLRSFSAQVFSTVYDRYMYLPLIGLALAFASALSEIRVRYEVRLALACLICGWWGWLSYKQVPVWHNDRSLFEHVLKTNPSSYSALVNIGVADVKARNLSAARANLEAARALNPRLAVALSNLAHVSWLEKNPAAVKEIGSLLYDPQFIAYNKQEPQALSLMSRMLGRVLVAEGNLAKGREALCLAVRLNPYDRDLANELAAFLSEHREQTNCDRAP